MTTACPPQLTCCDLGKQQVTARFDGGQRVSDAGLLPLRELDQQLGVLATIAQRLPEPRAQKLVQHSGEALLTQQVYQILADYPDCNDAHRLRDDPLFQTLAAVSPDGSASLASGPTLARFANAYTRREADRPLEEREVLGEIDATLSQRLRILNDYLPELFIRTRRHAPTVVMIGLDPSDDLPERDSDWNQTG